MSLLAKIASLRQVNINAHAEIEALKLQLADSSATMNAAVDTHEHHRELRDKLNAEIKTLKEELDETNDHMECVKDEMEETRTACALGRTLRLAEIKTLKHDLHTWAATTNLTLADRDAEIETLKGQVIQLQEVAEVLDTALHTARRKKHVLKLSLADRDEEVKTLKEDLDLTEMKFAPLAEEVKSLKDDAMRWRMLTAWEKATHDDTEDEDIWQTIGEIEGKINYKYFEKHYELVRIGDTIQEREEEE